MSEPTTYWQSLAAAADQGHLFLDETAAEACSRACSEYIDKLLEHQKKAKTLVNITGWGDFDSGRELQRIFAEKAAGGPNNMVDVLQSHIDVVREMQVVFGKFFTATQEVDDGNATHIQAQGPK